MKNFFKEFKEFISRGNIVDLSVAVIIGGAFSAIVTALTNQIIMPLVNLALSGSEGGLESAFTFLKVVYDADGAIDLTKSIYIDWGAFITAVLNFLIIAMTLFVIIKAAMASSKAFEKAREKAIERTKSKVSKDDKKAMKSAGINLRDKQAVAAYMDEKARLAAEAQAKADEEAAKKAEEERKANPTQEDLLKEIRDLLKVQNKK